jgi:hypothetical protein
MPSTTARAALAAVLAAATLTGCGLSRGSTPAGVQLTITEGFGVHRLRDVPAPQVAGGDTVMRLLERNANVAAPAGGAQVQSIDGLGGGRARGRPLDWFYYVNGVAPEKGAAATTLASGDRVWWDHHAAGGAKDVRAVVGSFPEPFLHGEKGKRFPVRVECTEPASAACSAVSHQLTGLGIPAARGGLLLAEYNQALRVLVGTWPRLRNDPAAVRIEQGPALSGVYARIDPGGRTLTLLDERGAAVRTLGAGAGLVAATRFNDAPPVWVVTGTDSAGVAAAARALEVGALRDRFALAIGPGDLGIPLPLRAAGPPA